MARIKSEGQCNLCGKTFSKQAMTRHLLACVLQPHPSPPSSRKRRRLAPVFHLLVQGYYAPEYWLHIEIAADAKLIDLDQFLRETWLECCGHLSAFTIENVKHNATGEIWDLNDRQSFWNVRLNFDFIDIDDNGHCFNKSLSEVLKPGLEFQYEYDFGSTTDLKLKVVAERESQIDRNSINILARNSPPAIPCESCREENAAQICTECAWEGEGWLCTKCARRHRNHKEMFLPVVNSPRVGVCGYTG